MSYRDYGIYGVQMRYIKIAGVTYTIEFLGNDAMGGNIGLADFDNQRIMINDGATEQTKQIAIVHEILHILDKAYNLKLTEEQVKYTAHAILALYKDNETMDLFNE